MKKIQHLSAMRGVTLMEMLTVVTIIGIMILISLPNVFKIIQMQRIRTSANDLMSKIRYTRNLAIKTHRTITMTVKTGNESFLLAKPGHTEYDLLQDIPGAIASAPNSPLGNQYKLYVEAGGRVCVANWNNARVSADACEYYVGESKRDNGVDTMARTQSGCSGDATNGYTLIFEPSGVLRDATCSFTLTNTLLNRSYEIVVYKGGQVLIQESL